MVYNTGFADHKAFEQLLLRGHALRTELDVLDLSHNGLGSITHRFIGGQVDIDADAEITRSAKLQLLDHDFSLNFDRNNPDDGSMYLDRMVRVWYCVGRLDLSKWYRVPVFTGPVTKVDRDGVVVNVECAGKEVLSNSPVWSAVDYGEGLRTRLVKTIMESVGETLFDWLDTSDSKTGGKTSLNRETSAMAVARKLANAAGMQLYYNGYGTLVLRSKTSKRQWTFDGRQLIELPQVGYDLGGVVNAVEFQGGKPKGAKKAVKARVVADRAHDLSPWKLGRNNAAGNKVPRYLPVFLEDTGTKKQAEADRIAKAELAAGLKQSVDASFNTLVIPHLEERDDFDLVTSEYVAQGTLIKATIPLTIGTMSVGYNKRVSPSPLGRVLRRA